MKARPQDEVRGIAGAHPFRLTPATGIPPVSGAWSDGLLAAMKPVDAMMALVAFNTNQAMTAQIGLAHSVARALRDHAAIVAAAGERAFAPGPMRTAVTGAASLQDDYASSIARTAQALGRRFGHLAFAFPATGPYR